ncbi:hypothetical protein GCM10009745_19760 [Kribbella yunnanensis]|uniref:DUF222 domain-containing protein n=1 Tax=Kribbella yunnanensis TaxID=190194 RepID=A0ABN2GTG6_9ACTN
MFEDDLTLLSTADLLESAVEHRAFANRAETRGLEHALVYADRFHPDACTPRPGRRSCDGRERAVVLGGEGCPEILEFAIAEYAAVLGVSHRIGATIIGDALALRHRFPFTWARVLSGHATPWKACRLVRDCMDLSEEAARYVDQRVAALIDTITPYRLDKIVKAAKMHIDPEGARAEAAAKVRERGVFIGRSDEHGTKTIYIRTSSGAATRFDATIHALSDAQQTLGDTRPTQTRRAEAVGIIADPVFAQELLTQAHHHPTPSPAPHDAAPPAAAAMPSNPDPVAPTSATPAPDTHAQDTPASATPAAGDSAADTSAPQSPAPAPATANTSNSNTATVTAATGASRAAAQSAASQEVPSPQAPAPRALGPGTLGPERGIEETGWGHGWVGSGEPGVNDEADRDAPHPSNSDLPDPLDRPDDRTGRLVEPFDAATCRIPDDGEPMDPAAHLALTKRLAQIKHDAYARLASPTTADTVVRPGKAVIYVHLTDRTLVAAATSTTGTRTRDGVVRAEGIGPLLTSQLSDLIGYGPYIVKPVIDLNDGVSVNCYEASERVRERVKLTHPVELFPYGTRETNHSIDLDHLEPYNPLGPPGQTNTQNLAPLGRYAHRVKTHARGWNVRRINPTTLEWTTPHGFVFHVNPTGTHRVITDGQDQSGSPEPG